MQIGQALLIPSKAPEQIRWDYINCTVDTGLKFYTPAELSKLDDHASGARFLTDDELAQIERALSARIGGKAGLQNEMQKACPETVEKAAAY